MKQTKLEEINELSKTLLTKIQELIEQPTVPNQPQMIQISERSYSLSETPITVAQYEQFCNETNTAIRKQPEPHHPDNPVTQITWHEAVAYCNWLGENYRLPTEDEFEHCCGDHIEATENTAIFVQAEIKRVKTKQPNKYELYDMLGCVWEWQSSKYSNTARVVRGGCWADGPVDARSAVRSRYPAGASGYFLGFRILCSHKAN